MKMAWAATKTSAGAGNWNTAGTWAEAAVPNQNDYVEIQHDVTVDVDAVFAGLFVNGGKLIWNSGWTGTVKDAAGTHATGEHIRISDDLTSGFYRTDTGNHLACTIQSVSATPTYRVKWLVEAVAGGPDADTRTLDLTYMRLKGHTVFLGNQTNYLWFNTGDPTNDGVMDAPIPATRDQKIDEDTIEGRAYGRVSVEAGSAGTLSLSCQVPWTGFQFQKLADMRDAHTRVAYIGEYCSMPKALIESLRPGRQDGPFIPYNIVLVEDI